MKVAPIFSFFLAMAVALVLSSCATRIELQSSFEKSDWLETFEPEHTLPWRQGESRTHIVLDSERGHSVLEISYPRGAVGPEKGGAQWISFLPAPSEKMRVSFWIRFPQDFNWVRGGKLPGLIGGKDEKTGWPITGGIRPTGKNGWSARIMWKESGEIIQYVYHMNQPGKYGDELKWMIDGKPAHFEKGVWQKLSTEVTLNDLGKRNGRIKSWLGERLVLDQADLEFRSASKIKIDAFYFSTFFGGEGADWAPAKDESVRFDDIRVVREIP